MMVLPVFARLYCVYRTPGTLVKMQTLDSELPAFPTSSQMMLIHIFEQQGSITPDLWTVLMLPPEKELKTLRHIDDRL